MRPVVLTVVSTVVDADGVALSQTPAGAGNLTINGVLASGGVATFAAPCYVTVTSAGNDSNRTFTITGTDKDGFALVEAFTGKNVGVATTIHRFKTVTKIAVSGATAAAVTAGTGALLYSDPCPMDFRLNPFSVGLGFDDSGTTTAFTVQHSFNDPWDPAYADVDEYNAEAKWFDHPSMAAMVADEDGNYASPVRAIRLKSNQAGTDTGTLMIVQSGR